MPSGVAHHAACVRRKSSRLNVVGGDPTGAAVFGRIEGDFLALAQTADAGALERRSMDEHVLVVVVRPDEAKALLVVVELNGARNHGVILGWQGERT